MLVGTALAGAVMAPAGAVALPAALRSASAVLRLPSGSSTAASAISLLALSMVCFSFTDASMAGEGSTLQPVAANESEASRMMETGRDRLMGRGSLLPFAAIFRSRHGRRRLRDLHAVIGLGAVHAADPRLR